jgi:hypothetical protein
LDAQDSQVQITTDMSSMSSLAEFSTPNKMAFQISDDDLKINHPKFEQKAMK